MEKEGLSRALEHVSDKGMAIQVLVTDTSRLPNGLEKHIQRSSTTLTSGM